MFYQYEAMVIRMQYNETRRISELEDFYADIKLIF